MIKRIFIDNKDDIIRILGEQDRNISIIEKKYNVNIVYYDYENNRFVIEIKGRKQNVLNAHLELLNRQKEDNLNYKNNNLNRISKLDVDEIKKEYKSNVVYVTYTGRQIRPLSKTQSEYIDSINKYDVVISIGPAGTGKTFLAVAQALSKLSSGKVNKVVLTRPVVESGERLGFLPGDLYEKINPYLRPLYDAFYIMLGPEKFRKFLDDEIIEIIPLAYMRGRTLEDAFIILDEAQNTVSEQMKMFLTRLGPNSQIVITGDITQIDLDKKKESGLVLIREILCGIKDIKFIQFTEKDVVRHELVKKIIKAYEIWENKRND
jgi:phosphate starvation-inducible PhoH-like protein